MAIGLEYIVKVYETDYKQVAEEIGVSSATIQDWLKGRRKIPSQRLEQLSGLFNLNGSVISGNITNGIKIKILNNRIEELL